MLKYCLRENLLTAKTDDYMAQVTDSQVFTLDDIIDRMVKRGTTVTRTDLAALMQLYTQECTYIEEMRGIAQVKKPGPRTDEKGHFQDLKDMILKDKPIIANLNHR